MKKQNDHKLSKIRFSVICLDKNEVMKMFIVLRLLFCFLLVINTASTLQDTKNRINIMTISDVHLNHEQKNAMEIDPIRNNYMNDLDLQTFFKLAYLIKHNIGEERLIQKAPDIVLYLGDAVGHVWNVNRTVLVDENENIVFTTLLDMFPQTPIISVFGNNDSFEKDYGRFILRGRSPYTVAMKSGFKNGFLSTGTLCDSENQFPCLFSQNEIHGFFSIKLRKNLLFVGLNTVMLSENSNVSPKRAMIQMKFLETQFDKAHVKGMSILIAMHIPVGQNVYDGSYFWREPYKDAFLKLIRKYHSRIIGLLVAHTHNEEFKIVNISEGDLIGQFFTAALSTSHGNSPSMKVYELSDIIDKWTIRNYVTYQFHQEGSEIVLSKYYEFLNTYCNHLQNEVNHTQMKDINSCLSQIQFNDTLPRFTVGNPNLDEHVSNPQAFYVN